MAEKSLAAKMKLIFGLRAALVNTPAGYARSLSAPHGLKLHSGLQAGPFDWMQVFVRTRAQLRALAKRLPSALNPGGILWISFPKGTSKIQTDLRPDEGWDSLKPLKFKWINLISVDETWSVFALRPYKPGEKQQSYR
jgi:hypothetical protein